MSADTETRCLEHVIADRQLLGAILAAATLEAVDVARKIIGPQDFFGRRERVIFESVLQMADRQDPPEIVRVGDDLRQRGRLDDIGGKIYLASLIDEIPLARNGNGIDIEYYSCTVRDQAQERGRLDKPDEATEELPTPKFRRTEAGNGKLIAHIFGDRLRFDHQRKRYLQWFKHYWTPDCDAAVRRLALDAAQHRYQQAADGDDPDERKRESKWAIDSESRKMIDNALYFAQATSPISDPGTNWDSDPWLLGCPNGVVDLRKGILRPGRQKDRITMTTGVPFDPDAKAPRWERFLQEIFKGVEELIPYIQKALGCSATGITKEQVFYICHGSGSNGKSVFLSAIRRALGDYSLNTPFSTVELYSRTSIPNDLAALHRRRFVTASETNQGTRLNEGRVKALTGCDPITARFLNSEFFTFEPVLKLWLAVNSLPKVGDLSVGFWRRVRLIPFKACFKGDRIDRDLQPTLTAEAPGILAWLVRGAVTWRKHGLEPTPEVVLAAVREYELDSDILGDFLREKCVLEPEATARGGDLYRAYTGWADENNIKGKERMSSTTFGRQLAQRFEKRHTREGKVYVGIRVL
jgi:putative DNA primase/helicase